MNIGSSAIACSGVARFSKTACAAAQHKSSVSVNSMAASRMCSGMLVWTWIFRSKGFFSFMGGPSAVVGCVATPFCSLGSRPPFCPCHHTTGRARVRLPYVLAQASAGAIVRLGGKGFLIHGRSVCAASRAVSNNKLRGL